MTSKSLKSLFYKSYEIQFIKQETISFVVYQENFQTLIGSKDGVTPFDYPILTEFKYEQNIVDHVKKLIDKELESRKT
jgi:hypothetical protein